MQAQGGTVTSTSPNRVEAVFVTSLLKFTDDVVFGLDADAKMLHFKSASRIGHSDLGANRKRMESILALLKERLS